MAASLFERTLTTAEMEAVFDDRALVGAMLELEAALADARPSGDNGFKIELARRILVRALTSAAAGTPPRIAALPASPFSTTSGALQDA